MKIFPKPILESLCLLFCSISQFLYSQEEWTLKKESEGIKVYTAPLKDPKLIRVKSEANIKTNFDCLEQVIRSVPEYPSWVFKCEKAEVVKMDSPDEIFYYQLNNAPWPVKSRDMVVHLKMVRETDRLIINSESVDGMLKEKSGIVRIEHFNSDWIFTSGPDSTINVSNIISLDPGGNIPSKIVKKFVVDGPYNTMLQLQKKASQNSCRFTMTKTME